MSTTTIQQNFLQAYDLYANKVFAYCYSETHHRDVAQYLTRTTFNDAWDTVTQHGFDSIRNVKKLVFQIAKSKISDFTSAQEREIKFHNNLWNLTLSQ